MKPQHGSATGEAEQVIRDLLAIEQEKTRAVGQSSLWFEPYFAVVIVLRRQPISSSWPKELRYGLPNARNVAVEFSSRKGAKMGKVERH